VAGVNPIAAERGGVVGAVRLIGVDSGTGMKTRPQLS
jgi:hypothetical protein